MEITAWCVYKRGRGGRSYHIFLKDVRPKNPSLKKETVLQKIVILQFFDKPSSAFWAERNYSAAASLYGNKEIPRAKPLLSALADTTRCRVVSSERSSTCPRRTFSYHPPAEHCRRKRNSSLFDLLHPLSPPSIGPVHSRTNQRGGRRFG